MVGRIKFTGKLSAINRINNELLCIDMFAGNCIVKEKIRCDNILMLTIETDYDINSAYLVSLSDKYHVNIEYSISDHRNHIKHNGIVVFENNKAEIIEEKKFNYDESKA